MRVKEIIPEETQESSDFDVKAFLAEHQAIAVTLAGVAVVLVSKWLLKRYWGSDTEDLVGEVAEMRDRTAVLLEGTDG